MEYQISLKYIKLGLLAITSIILLWGSWTIIPAGQTF